MPRKSSGMQMAEVTDLIRASQCTEFTSADVFSLCNRRIKYKGVVSTLNALRRRGIIELLPREKHDAAGVWRWVATTKSDTVDRSFSDDEPDCDIHLEPTGTGCVVRFGKYWKPARDCQKVETPSGYRSPIG